MSKIEPEAWKHGRLTATRGKGGGGKWWKEREGTKNMYE